VIVKRGDRYGVRVYDRSLRAKRWCGTYSTLREAREVEHREASRHGATSTETCGGFAERWLRDYPREAAASQRTYSYAIRRFATDFAKGANRRPGSGSRPSVGAPAAAVECPGRSGHAQRRDQ
jgi:hypothetical protein